MKRFGALLIVALAALAIGASSASALVVNGDQKHSPVTEEGKMADSHGPSCALTDFYAGAIGPDECVHANAPGNGQGNGWWYDPVQAEWIRVVCRNGTINIGTWNAWVNTFGQSAIDGAEFPNEEPPPSEVLACFKTDEPPA